jgi:glutamate formiminotransferase
MRASLIIVVLLTLGIPVFAGKDKNKDWQSGTLVDVKTQDMQSSSYSNPNEVGGDKAHAPSQGAASRGMTGGSFSGAPTHFIIYNILLETSDELIWAKLSREVSYKPPELKTGSEIKWKPGGPKFVEIMDEKGRKFDFQVVKRQKKSEQEKKN